MRTIDLTPLYRTSVGFDRMASTLDALTRSENGGGYPPYNIEKLAEDDYRITVAVAGFSEADISIESKDGELVISGARQERDQAETQYLHRGIAERAFERRFKLADHVRAVGARLENGLLHVDLVREVPEALKPRKITIETTQRTGEIAAE
ncbi:MAG: Hsp20 family protein [Neomegalonema sp.]|nr:Hsp20 family protein [Neomegalonema sp.]